MILLAKDTVNKIALTLTERSELPGPYWVLVFKPDLLSALEHIVQPADSSPFPRRFNELTVIDIANYSAPGYMLPGYVAPVADGMAGEVNLPTGWGTYRVYESPFATVDLADTTGRVLEVGRYYVQEDEIPHMANDVTNVYR